MILDQSVNLLYRVVGFFSHSHFKEEVSSQILYLAGG
jgi:hypothetical protein